MTTSTEVTTGTKIIAYRFADVLSAHIYVMMKERNDMRFCHEITSELLMSTIAQVINENGENLGSQEWYKVTDNFYDWLKYHYEDYAANEVMYDYMLSKAQEDYYLGKSTEDICKPADFDVRIPNMNLYLFLLAGTYSVYCDEYAPYSRKAIIEVTEDFYNKFCYILCHFNDFDCDPPDIVKDAYAEADRKRRELLMQYARILFD